MMNRFYINWNQQEEVPDPEGWAVYADDALLMIAEIEAYIEDRERHINEMSGDLVTYERRINGCSATLTEQHETIDRQRARIVTLESRLNECEATINRMSDDNEELQTTNEELLAQLTAALATIEAATWCEDCGMPVEHCRENHATGHDYAEGCKP